jgi:hypothetical protein
MRSVKWIAPLLVVALLAVAAPPSFGTASFHDCGDVAATNSFGIEAKRVRCGQAKRVVRAYSAAVGETGDLTQDVLGFHCKVVGLYGDGGTHRCAAKGHRVVRFLRGG